MDKIKWYTKARYVDLETGEVVDKSKYLREYYKVRSNKKTKIEEYVHKGQILKRGIIEYETECRKKEQLRLFEE